MLLPRSLQGAIPSTFAPLCSWLATQLHCLHLQQEPPAAQLTLICSQHDQVVGSGQVLQQHKEGSSLNSQVGSSSRNGPQSCSFADCGSTASSNLDWVEPNLTHSTTVQVRLPRVDSMGCTSQPDSNNMASKASIHAAGKRQRQQVLSTAHLSKPGITAFACNARSTLRPVHTAAAAGEGSRCTKQHATFSRPYTSNSLDSSSSSSSSSEVRMSGGGGDRIHLRGMRFYGRHGVLPEETMLGQVFHVDATLHSDCTLAGGTDDLQHTVSYADAYRDIQAILEGPPFKLLEAVAHTICSTLLHKYDRLSAVTVHVQKTGIPGVPSIINTVGVEITRMRSAQT